MGCLVLNGPNGPNGTNGTRVSESANQRVSESASQQPVSPISVACSIRGVICFRRHRRCSTCLGGMAFSGCLRARCQALPPSTRRGKPHHKHLIHTPALNSKVPGTFRVRDARCLALTPSHRLGEPPHEHLAHTPALNSKVPGTFRVRKARCQALPPCPQRGEPH